MPRHRGRRHDWIPPKRRRFALEFLKDLNATQAALRAGYSPKTANEQGCQLLANINVQLLIQQAMDARSQRTEITVDRVLQEVARLAFADLRALYDEHGKLKPITQLDDDTAATVAGFEVLRRLEPGPNGEPLPLEVVKLKTWDKTANLTLLMRHLKLLTDKMEHSGDPDRPIQVSMRRRDAD